MKDRREVVDFINEQLKVPVAMYDSKHGKMHYGVLELKQLMDYLYDGPPTKEGEHLMEGYTYWGKVS